VLTHPLQMLSLLNSDLHCMSITITQLPIIYSGAAPAYKQGRRLLTFGLYTSCELLLAWLNLLTSFQWLHNSACMHHMLSGCSHKLPHLRTHPVSHGPRTVMAPARSPLQMTHSHSEKNGWTSSGSPAGRTVKLLGNNNHG
jgi:hypothetical protein